MSTYDDVTSFDTGGLILDSPEPNEEPFDRLALVPPHTELAHEHEPPGAAAELDAAVSTFVEANRRLVQLVHAAKRQGLGSNDIVRRTSLAWPAEVTLDILAKSEKVARAAKVLRAAGVSVADTSTDGDGDTVVSLHSSWSRRLVCLHVHRPTISQESTRWSALTVVGALHTAGYRLLVHPHSPLTPSSAVEYFADPAAILVIEEPSGTASYPTYT
ncbi:hypothetical protein NBRGN_066_00630 [Nocardia brasiliensis NBRC 14402]|uniref:hypothetical protein n=1 Tax=Nocardia brasiliensis TaxID=37326 RepID=UPI0003167FF5|nr:hypothetical protein [Nocardia brasiliensis]ASF08192.1 hypothetical protein CEQ30_13465 [Nocardia brasiliensis]GAJ83838.1 hypothetical protein NBRGN_066_00630 [Nocardia brasiliensis NBRC 14402]SUB54129.1 Uncharacterised protein [Nocardia brasiliensis]